MNDNELVLWYYKSVSGMTAYHVDSVASIFRLLRKAKRKDNIYITNNRYVRKALSVLGMNAVNCSTAQKSAEQFCIQLQMFQELNAKGVLCYYFGRPEMRRKVSYSPLAQERIKDKLSFPKMSENYVKYEQHFREILGSRCSAEYINNLKKVPQVIYRGQLFGHEDVQTKLIHTINGRRQVTSFKEGAARTIHIYGRCGVFGYAVEDAETIPSYLQKILSEDGKDIKVINHGIWGADDDLILNNLLVDSAKYSDSDIVIVYERVIPDADKRQLMKVGVQCFDCTAAFYESQASDYCFYDVPGHMSGEGYQVIADYIADCLSTTGFANAERSSDALEPVQDLVFEYLQSVRKSQFNANLEKYLDEIVKAYPPLEENKKTGAIVMNCNPFTLGHRYLIEYASERVDRLFVFVLQEDKSFFSFEARLKLVKQGTADMENVIVLPSGEFMISSLTFPEYFMKEYKKSKEFDAANDLGIFTSSIAPCLGISVRFAGEEPLDIVTREYNRNMRILLPEAGIEFCEVPRKTVDEANVISASKVRVLLREGSWDDLKAYVPVSTYKYLVGEFQKTGDEQNS